MCRFEEYKKTDIELSSFCHFTKRTYLKCSYIKIIVNVIKMYMACDNVFVFQLDKFGTLHVGPSEKGSTPLAYIKISTHPPSFTLPCPHLILEGIIRNCQNYARNSARPCTRTLGIAISIRIHFDCNSVQLWWDTQVTIIMVMCWPSLIEILFETLRNTNSARLSVIEKLLYFHS